MLLVVDRAGYVGCWTWLGMFDLTPNVRPPQGGIPEQQLRSAVNSVKKLRINGLGGKLFRSEDGQALVEYAAMLGILLALLFIAQAVGFQSNRLFQWVVSALQ
jgi:hypothetical protein